MNSSNLHEALTTSQRKALFAKLKSKMKGRKLSKSEIDLNKIGAGMLKHSFTHEPNGKDKMKEKGSSLRTRLAKSIRKMRSGDLEKLILGGK